MAVYPFAGALTLGAAITIASYAQEPINSQMQRTDASSKVTRARVDPAYPPRVGEAFYPKDSKKRGEQGICVVNVTVAADGTVEGAVLTSSTGYSSLDKACLRALNPGKMIPATVDGKPIKVSQDFTIHWLLVPST